MPRTQTYLRKALRAASLLTLGLAALAGLATTTASASSLKAGLTHTVDGYGIISPPARVSNTTRSFTISADGTTFLKDGQPHRILSAGFHYFRCPPEEWEERLLAIKAAGGINTIQTYIAWNFHCPDSEDECDFTGERDIVRFLQLCQKHGFDVLLRPGPYICAEWEFGGFPAWIVAKHPSIVLRTADPIYLGYVERWYKKLLPLVQPYMYANGGGGTVLMVQVENEYGSFTLIADLGYLTFLRDLTASLVGKDVLLYSTDPAVSIDTSTVGGVFQAIDFLYWGEWLTNVSWWWEQQQQAMLRPNARGDKSLKGPPMNDEFYPGWLSQWNDPYVYSHTPAYVNTLVSEMMINTPYNTTSNVNFYMFFGGTNFGFWNGGSVTTSYDYGAPLNESGHATEKFYELQQNIFPKIAGLGNYGISRTPSPLPDTPLPTYYGDVDFSASPIKLIKDHYPSISSSYIYNSTNKSPTNMEVLGQSYGYVYYSFGVPTNTNASKKLASITYLAQDYAMVSFDDIFVGLTITVNGVGNYTLPVPTRIADANPTVVSLLVENTGRTNDALPFEEVWKGMRNPIVFTYTDGSTVESAGVLETRTLPMSDKLLQQLWGSSVSDEKMTTVEMKRPATPLLSAGDGVTPAVGDVGVGYFARGTITIDKVVGGTLIDMRPFGKGFVYVNGRNVGRYYTMAGPQYSLFVPRSYLQQGVNEIIVFEQAQPYSLVDGVAGIIVPRMTLSNVNYNVRKETDPREPLGGEGATRRRRTRRARRI